MEETWGEVKALDTRNRNASPKAAKGSQDPSHRARRKGKGKTAGTQPNGRERSKASLSRQ
jgi:hypothetical protein